MSLSPLIALGRAKLQIGARQWQEAASTIAALLASEPAESPIREECLELVRGAADSGPLLDALARALREHPEQGDAAQAITELLWTGGFTAAAAGDHSRAVAMLENCRALTQLAPEADCSLLRILVSSAFALRDFEKRRRYLGALLAYNRLTIAEQPPAADTIEIDTTRHPPEEAAAILAAHGVVVLRGVMEPSRFPPLIAAFEECNPNESIAVRIGDTPIMDLARTLVAPYLTDIVRHLLGGEPCLLPQHCFMRGLKLGQHRMVPFHQDMNNFEAEMINCWVPLTPCLDTAPRLEVVAKRLHELVETQLDTGDFKWIAELLVRERFPAESIVAPPVALGDAIMILPSTIHRSFATEDTVNKRFSIEIRFGAAP